MGTTQNSTLNSTIIPWIDILDECYSLSHLALEILRNCVQNPAVGEMIRQHVKDAENALFIAYHCLSKINQKQELCDTQP